MLKPYIDTNPFPQLNTLYHFMHFIYVCYKPKTVIIALNSYIKDTNKKNVQK